jgi:type 1 fimbriae regulatory protein FimB
MNTANDKQRHRRERSREYLTSDEIDKLLTTAKEGATRNAPRDYCILVLLYHHGLRASELCDLRLSDIDLLSSEPTIYVRHQKSGGKGTRTHASVHPLYKLDVAALRNWLKIREDMELENDYLFVSERRDRLNRATIWLMLTVISEAAGLSHLNIHPHSLRHACGYTLINKGVDLRRVSSFLGHKSLQTTVRYTELAPGRFDKLF